LDLSRGLRSIASLQKANVLLLAFFTSKSCNKGFVSSPFIYDTEKTDFCGHYPDGSIKLRQQKISQLEHFDLL